eukprot:8091241-Pyramimonas_sp.AAC.1
MMPGMGLGPSPSYVLCQPSGQEAMEILLVTETGLLGTRFDAAACSGFAARFFKIGRGGFALSWACCTPVTDDPTAQFLAAGHRAPRYPERRLGPGEWSRVASKRQSLN